MTILIHSTLNQVAEVLPTLLKSNIVPFLHSSPALGKSSIVRQIANKYNLELIDVRLTEMDSTDFNGLPSFKDGKATYSPFDVFPTVDTPLPKGKKGWILLLDEFSSGLPSVQASCYKLILDRKVGQHELHPNCKMVACSNLDSDNAIVNTISSALVSRFAHFYIQPNVDEWQDWAISNKINPLITSFINFKPNCFYTFNADVVEPYASPRTWQMLNRVLDANTPLIVLASLLGSGVATEFNAYLQTYKDLPDIDSILADPEHYKIPKELGVQWATLTMVVSHINKDIDKCVTYLKRFNPEMHMVALREIKGRYPDLLSHATIRQWLIEISRSVYGKQ